MRLSLAVGIYDVSHAGSSFNLKLQIAGGIAVSWCHERTEGDIVIADEMKRSS